MIEKYMIYRFELFKSIELQNNSLLHAIFPFTSVHLFKSDRAHLTYLNLTLKYKSD